jgi:hypothetical protein
MRLMLEVRIFLFLFFIRHKRGILAETLKNEKLEILDWTGTGDEESGLASS